MLPIGLLLACGGPIASGNPGREPAARSVLKQDAAPVAPRVTAVPVWTDDSVSVEIRWSSWGEGYSFKRDRAQLSATQIALLGAIETFVGSGPCGADVDEVQLTIVRASGGVDEYYASADRCEDERRPTVDYQRVAALLATVHCLWARGYDGSALASAPHISVGDGCHHGLFSGHSQWGPTPEWWFLVDVPSAGQVRFAIERCGDRQLKIDLFDQTGLTAEASVQPTGSECTALVHDFPAAGTHALHVTKVAGTYIGDFFLSVERVP